MQTKVFAASFFFPSIAVLVLVPYRDGVRCTLSGVLGYFGSSISQHIFGVQDAILLASEEDGKACGLELLMVYAKAGSSRAGAIIVVP